jgi:hypothetical protein
LRPFQSSIAEFDPFTGRAWRSFGGFSSRMYCDEDAATNGLTPTPSSPRTGVKRSFLNSTSLSVLLRLILVGPTYSTMSPLVRSCT